MVRTTQSLAAGLGAVVRVESTPMAKGVDWRRYGALGSLEPPGKPKICAWRSADIRGFLPIRIAQSLETAMASMPRPGAPIIDEEAWWRDVLTDPRVRTPTAKSYPPESRHARVRLDRINAESVTFFCAQCKRSQTLTVAELIARFGTDRNVYAINDEAFGCGDKRSRREGYDCSVSVEITPRR